MVAISNRGELTNNGAEGVERFYRLDEAGIAGARAFVEEVWARATARFLMTADNLIEEE